MGKKKKNKKTRNTAILSLPKRFASLKIGLIDFNTFEIYLMDSVIN